MRAIGSLVAAICVSLLLTDAAAAADCVLKQLASLPMLGDPSEAVVVEVGVAGKPLRFLVDTGGIYSAFAATTADALKLDAHLIRNGMEVYGFAGREGEHYVNVPDLVAGAVHLDTVAMIEAKPPDGLDGILGPDFLARFDLDFDFAGKKLNLMAKQHCEGQVVYWTRDPYAAAAFDLSKAHIVVPVNLDGHDVSAMLDTGMGVTGIEETAARSTFGVSESSPGVQIDPKRGPDSVERFRYRFKLLSLGGLGVSNPTIGIFHDTFGAGYREAHPGSVALSVYDESQTVAASDFILGLNVLSKFHVFVSYQDKKIYLTPANAH